MSEQSLVDLTEAKKLRDKNRFREAVKAADEIERDLKIKWELGDIEEIPYLLQILRVENFRISVLFGILIGKKAKGGK